jgi:prolyl-tRNA synthetase
VRLSKIFGKTLRDDPADATLDSHRLMQRAGMIHQVATGLYSYMPLGWRSLRNVEQIIREEMDDAGGQELRMSVLQPRELWKSSGRDAEYGPDMFRLEDRGERELVLAPTHEELLTTMVRSNVNSYRDLPLILYQIQTKFRDEPRPRGGLLRVREFDMKDAYSFDVDEDGLDLSYQAMVRGYKNIFKRCGLEAIVVEADSGTIGGKDSQEFVLLAEAGEDTVLLCEQCGYAANVERAAFVKPAQDVETPGALEEVNTPGVKTIEQLADMLHVPTSKTIKAVFYHVENEVVVVAIRGDLDVNEIKLRNALGGAALRLAKPAEVERAGLVAGSASPVGLAGIKVVADDSIELGSNFVAGANKQDYHLLNVNHPRDFQVDIFTDIALAREGYACPNCSTALVARRGIEVGHVFKLGTRYSESLGARFPNENGEQNPIIMGCYGIGIGRLLAAVIEQNHDEHGMVLPSSIAPYQVWITALNVEREDVSQAAEALYKDLRDAGVEVLYDDREAAAGVKFNDADLLGLPVRVVVSPRNLREDAVEIKRRSESEAVKAPLGDAVGRIKEMLAP